MIAFNNEQEIDLYEAAVYFRGRKGRPVTYQTIRKWTIEGVRGVILETYRSGGRILTSVEAVKRFIARLNENDRAAPILPPSPNHSLGGLSASDLLTLEFGPK